MDLNVKAEFARLWAKYFNGAELPLVFYYTDEEGRAEFVKPGSVARCLIGALSQVRKGKSFSFGVDSIGCPGGKRYAGFTQGIMPDFEYFLSCGIPGKLEGERYKKSPELVKQAMKYAPSFEAPARYIVFKRWDKLDERDTPEAVIFFARPDVLAGLFTLSNYDEAEPNGVLAPFGSGCSTIVLYPYMEARSSRPHAIIGMFDVSARPYVPENAVTFSIPMGKFARMVANMDESFLTTSSWKKVQSRIE